MNLRNTAISVLTLLAACGDSGNGGAGSLTNFSGIFSGADGTTSGSITFAIAAAASSAATPTAPALVQVTVTGTLTPSGAAAVALTGTFETTTGALTLTGGGYTITGVFDGVDQLEGTYTGPAGATGGFVTTETTTATPATTYCGTYTQDDLSDAGTFSVVIHGTTVVGRWASTVDGSVGALAGTISGNAITIAVFNTSGGQDNTAVGTRSGTTISGTATGATWQGSVCQ